MQTVNIEVTNRHAKTVGAPVLVCNNTGDKVVFTFDEEWSGVEQKTARFVFIRAGKAIFQEVDFTGDTVEIPPLSHVREVKIGVYAGALTTTTAARVPCEPSILCEVGEDTANAYELGRQKERESLLPTMWEAITCGGATDRSYAKAFMGLDFDNTTFKPESYLNITDATSMFENCSVGLAEEKQLDFAEEENEWLYFSKCTKATKAFYGCELFKSLYYADFCSIESAMYFRQVFAYSTIQRIEYFRPPTLPMTSTFANATQLSYIGFDGEIGHNANFQACPLTNEGAINIIQALADANGTEYDYTYTLTLSDEVWANLDALGNVSPNGNTWREYAQDKKWNT